MTDDAGCELKLYQYAVGAGFHARPAWVNGKLGFARTKWCAGCALTFYAAT